MADESRKVVVVFKSRDVNVRFEIDPVTFESTVIGEFRPEDRKRVAAALEAAIEQLGREIDEDESRG